MRGGSCAVQIPETLRFRDQAQEERYAILAKRNVLPTRYLDEHAITTLGLDRFVHNLISNIGWTKFVSLKSHTYSDITLEFLSSFAYRLQAHDRKDDGEIFFRLKNRDFTLHLSAINEIFGFENEGVRTVAVSYNEHDAWGAFSDDGSYKPWRSKSSGLISPVHCYLHRVMSQTLFARDESAGVVNRNELFCLWAMENNVKVNSGVWLLHQLNNVAKARDGSIVIGGLITTIANHLGIQDLVNPLTGNDRIDLDDLVQMRICKKTLDGRYILKRNAGEEEDGDTTTEEEPPEAEHTDVGVHEQPPLTEEAAEMIMQKLVWMERFFEQRFDWWAERCELIIGHLSKQNAGEAKPGDNSGGEDEPPTREHVDTGGHEHPLQTGVTIEMLMQKLLEIEQMIYHKLDRMEPKLHELASMFVQEDDARRVYEPPQEEHVDVGVHEQPLQTAVTSETLVEKFDSFVQKCSQKFEELTSRYPPLPTQQ